MILRLKDCHNFGDFRKLAKLKLPSPIFHYIDGAADDEITYARNTSAFDDVDLVQATGSNESTVFQHSEVIDFASSKPVTLIAK